MNRRRFALAICAGLLAALHAAPAPAQIGPGQQVTLQQTLDRGLKVRLARERRFVRRVVQLVGRGTLTEELVLSVFKKARYQSEKAPFYRFLFMMKAIAKENGIPLTF